MSRIAKSPVSIPKDVTIELEGNVLTVKGSKGALGCTLNAAVGIEQENGLLYVKWNKDDKTSTAQAGTARAIINSMVHGVSQLFEKKLSLVGVGYRAQAKDNVISLSLGFSHPVEYQVPAGIVAETPSQTEIVLKGANKQLLGQVAAEIRAFRPPEPYKGKGVRYAEEYVPKKEAKKK